MLSEIWKPCPNYEDSYEVSNLGYIRGVDRVSGNRRGIIKGKVLKRAPNRKKYLESRLFKNGKCIPKIIHRLVAIAFIPNPLNLPQVNHIDGDKNNCKESNLEWVDNSYNQLHAYKLGLQTSKKGENNGRAKLTDLKVTYLKNLYNSGQEIKDIAKSESLNLSTLRQLLYGSTWKCNSTILIKRDKRKKNQLYETIKIYMQSTR